MTDKELYKLCKKWGRKALHARYRFEGLLPEVNKRRLYERRGFESIYVFAAKLAGMNHEQVDKVLRLEKRFEPMQILHEALVKGEVSANKLVRVASIATVENQSEMLAATKNLSKTAIDVFVKDHKNEHQDGLIKPLFDIKTLPGQSLKLDYDVEKELIEMQEKGIDINAFLRKTLEKRKLDIVQQKEELSGRRANSRPVPVKIIHLMHAEYGIKCSIPNCNKPAKVLHHTARFALTKSHDPHYLAPLCEGHHQLVHAIDVRVQAAKVFPSY